MIELTLPYPVSSNRYWASRIVKPRAGPAFVSTYVTPEAQAYREQVKWLCLAAGIRKPLNQRVRVELDLYPHRPLDFKTRMRKHGAAWDDTVQCMDLTNAEKVLLDALNDVAIEDDSKVWRYTARRMEPDEKGARCVVRIEAIAIERPQGELLGASA